MDDIESRMVLVNVAGRCVCVDVDGAAKGLISRIDTRDRERDGETEHGNRPRPTNGSEEAAGVP